MVRWAECFLVLVLVLVLLNIFETWLDEQVTIQANIKHYNIFRSDRKDGTKGGVAIYVYEKLVEAKEIYKISHRKCEMIEIHLAEIQSILQHTDHQKTKKRVFDIILNELEKILKSVEKSEQTIIISGKFNFSFVR